MGRQADHRHEGAGRRRRLDHASWNFLTAMIARKAAAALATGCTIVCKPASQTPYSALAYGVIADERSACSKGVLNVVTGSAGEIADEMCENPKLRKITFTGSTEVGKRLASNAAKYMKRTSMELGGNAPPHRVRRRRSRPRRRRRDGVVEIPELRPDLRLHQPMLVQASVYDAFAEKLSAAVQKMKVGDGMEDGVQQGPLIDESAVKKIEEHIADATSKGAKVVTGGHRHAKGLTFFEPTVLTGVTPRHARREGRNLRPRSPRSSNSRRKKKRSKWRTTPNSASPPISTRKTSRAPSA
ncbi:MAG: aldehyde dehydrogenase family protein [Parvularculaceae bacterium]